MAAAAENVGAEAAIGPVLLVVVVPVLADFEIRLEAVEILVEDQVDDTAHRVGAPGSRGAAGHHVNALDQRRGDGAEVHAAAQGIGGHDALAVKQHQRSCGAKVSQRDAVNTRVALGRVTRLAAIVQTFGRAQRGELADGVAQIDVGFAFKLGHAHHRHRGGLGIARDRDAGCGNDNLFDIAAALRESTGRGHNGKQRSGRAAQHEFLEQIVH